MIYNVLMSEPRNNTPKKRQISKATSRSSATPKARRESTAKAEKKQPVKSTKAKPTAKAVKKKSVKKESTQATKRLKKTATTKTLGSKSKTAKKVSQTVTVPNNVPLRSLEKAELLRSELSLYWQKSMYRIAVVSGLCFLLLGSTFASVNVFDATPSTKNTAQVISAVKETVPTKLTLLSTVPDILIEPNRVLFTLTSVYPESVEYYLRNEVTQNTLQTMRVENFADIKYALTLSPKDLKPGDYKLLIRYTEKKLLTNAADATRTEAIAQFSIPEVEKNTATTLDAKTNTTPTTEDSQKSLTEPIEPVVEKVVENTDPVLEEKIKIPTIVNNPSAVDSDDTAISDSVVVQPESDIEISNNDLELKEKEPLSEPAALVFSLSINEREVSGLLTMGIQDAGLSSLELYARPVTSLNSRFISKATQKSGTKVFTVNTVTFLPNGTYEFYATGVDNNGTLRTTQSTLITVQNSQITRPVTDESSSIVSATPENPIQEERVFAPANLDDQNDNFASLNDIQEASKRLYRNDRESITQLLNSYASARQSGDEILVKAAQAALAKKEAELANSALVDKELVGISDDVILDMSQKFSDLRKRVDTFEQIRKEKSNGQSALDTDNDGIPDFDEINLYQTNPNEPDTDGDGFTDGVEIVRGFDPLNDTAEAVIAFESPKESVGLVQADVLTVEEVIPSLNSIAQANDPTVRAEIRGRGLPNSFVTLYIYSNPTVVTIKTDSDGSFVYTLDKELEDGTHDVFVALTDNTGSIVAQSNPFSFVKEAQAFTPVDAAGGTVVGSDSVIEKVASNSYNAVVGVGVLAFGLILLMLGFSLRRKEDDLDQGTGRMISDDMVDTASKTSAKAT